jgi:hypothetical protein
VKVAPTRLIPKSDPDYDPDQDDPDSEGFVAPDHPWHRRNQPGYKPRTTYVAVPAPAAADDQSGGVSF